MSALFDYKHTFTHHHYNLATGDQVSEMVPIIPATNWGKKFCSPKMKTILSWFAYFQRSMEWELRICALPKTQAPFRAKWSKVSLSVFCKIISFSKLCGLRKFEVNNGLPLWRVSFCSGHYPKCHCQDVSLHHWWLLLTSFLQFKQICGIILHQK